jgi:hypothetical protein
VKFNNSVVSITTAEGCRISVWFCRNNIDVACAKSNPPNSMWGIYPLCVVVGRLDRLKREKGSSVKNKG